MKAIYLTWLSDEGRPKVLRIPLALLWAPFLVFFVLSLVLAILWQSPWAPQKLEDGLARLERENERLERQVETAQEGLDRSRKSVRMAELTWKEVRELAGMPAAKEQGAQPATSEEVDVERMLETARGIRSGYDSSLRRISQRPMEVGRLPTIRPVRSGHPLVESFGPSLDLFTGQELDVAGLSWGVPEGTPVWSTGAGKVVGIGQMPRWGKYVLIQHDERCQTFYGHLSRIDVAQEDDVVRGQVIGLSGTTGKTTGPRVFYAVFLDGIAADPRSFLLPEAL